MLTAIGTGACFNYQDGNTACFYYDNEKKTLLLIDCGETVFHSLLENKLLDNVEALDVLITHLHSDHVGSLSSLLHYCQYVLNIKPNVIYPDQAVIPKYLVLSGNDLTKFNIITPEDYSEYEIKSIKQKHSAFIDAYGYIININGHRLYYSGDAATMPEEVIELFNNNEIKEMYVDVTCYNNDAHLHIDDLSKLINQSDRKRVYVMHFDNDKLKDEAKSLGFSIVRGLK